MTDPAPTSTAWLAEAAAAVPLKRALLAADGTSLTYAELASAAADLAARIEPGPDPIGIEIAPGIGHAIAVHAAMLAGRPLQTIRPGLPAAEREQVLAAGEVSEILGPEDLAPVAARSTPGVAPSSAVFRGAPDRTATLARVLSSGTTGPRRPVDLSFGNFAASAVASAANLGVDEDDLWLACLPMDHVGGLSILIRSAIYRTAALIHERFEVGEVAAALASEPRVTVVSLVPTQLGRLLEAGAELDRLRAILVGGAALSPELLERCLGLGLPVVQSYGLTQACSQVCTMSPGEAGDRPGSSGRPLPGLEVRIAAEAAGRPGEVEVRGPVVAAGAAGVDGWLRTGDIGRLDADGYLWVEGRADDTIVSGGENVRPEPVEARLESHPAVAEAAVIGRPDPDWGEAVTAVVVPAAGADPTRAELIAYCRETLAPAMVPKRIELAPALPRTASGKLQRARLRS